MAIISVDTAMLQFPGLVLNALEIGGVCLDDDREMVDVLDAVKDPDRLYFIDVNSDKCRIHDSQEENVDLDSTFEEASEGEQEINAGGTRKEENLRDLITRYNKEDAFEESAEQLLARLQQSQRSGNSPRITKVLLRSQTRSTGTICARLVSFEKLPGVKKMRSLKTP